MRINKSLLLAIVVSLLIVVGIYLIVLPSLVHSLPTTVTPQQVIKASDKAFGGQWAINTGVSGNVTVLPEGIEKVTYLNNFTITQPCSFCPHGMISQEYFLIYSSTNPYDGGYFRIYKFNNVNDAEIFFTKMINTTQPLYYRDNLTLNGIRGVVLSFANTNITVAVAIYGKYVYIVYMYYYRFSAAQFITFLNAL